MNNNEIYGFAFGKTIASGILYRLKNIDCCYLVFGVTSIEQYLNFLIKGQPEYILGLGVYKGIDQDEIRIEEVCTNKFKNGFIEDDKFEISKINPYLKPNKLSKLAGGIENSYCNYISYKIINLIQAGELKSKYTFLHIPKSFNAQISAKTIDEMIFNFKAEIPKT